MYYSDVDTELDFDEADLTKYIQKLMESHKVRGFQKASVIPLSGKWALLAEDLRNSPENIVLRRQVQKACTMFCKTSETYEKEGAPIFDKLKDQSNILKLKTRFE